MRLEALAKSKVLCLLQRNHPENPEKRSLRYQETGWGRLGANQISH